jgi:hypothetical protein
MALAMCGVVLPAAHADPMDSWPSTYVMMHKLDGTEPHDMEEVAAVANSMSAYYHLDPGAAVRLIQQQVQRYCPDMDAALTAAGAWTAEHPAPAVPPLVDVQWLAGVGVPPCQLSAWAPGVQVNGCPR